MLQGELDTGEVRILGVNAAGYEEGNASICEGRDLAWLQDTEATDAWGLWGIEWRDLVLRDPNGAVTAVVSLTEYDLADPDNLEMVRGLLDDAR